jgi:hypothetical protein
MRLQRKYKKDRKESRLRILILFHGCHEGGRWEKQRMLLSRGTQPLGHHPALLFLLPLPPQVPLWRLAPRVLLSLGWTSLPTTAVDRNSSTTWLHLSLARRSLIVNLPFPHPVSQRQDWWAEVSVPESHPTSASPGLTDPGPAGSSARFIRTQDGVPQRSHTGRYLSSE